MASEVFSLQLAMSPTPMLSTLTGTLEVNGISESCTLYVLWMSGDDVQEILSNEQDSSTSCGNESLLSTSRSLLSTVPTPSITTNTNMCPLDIESQTSTTSLPPLLTSPTHSLCLPPDTVLQPSTTLSIFPPIPLGPLTSTTHNIRLPPDAIPPITSTHSIVPSPDTMALTSPTRSISPPLYIATPATPTHSISSPLEPVPILSPTLEVDHDLDDHFMSDG
ncbi:uncharacterized protein LOC111190304 [Astyanax mexicanus]|uniref:uncharacterized protein LOC111190304 n=1 Tax=Astyanax mexicanus TaxID=7994 RepID=UPI000BBD4B96|nr:uncharacterized protein LOC111190304 [Astyanax mexicanus]